MCARQADDVVVVPYPLNPQQLSQVVIESGCGEVKAPPEVSIIEHEDPINGKGQTKTKKYAAGAAAVVQLLASICTVDFKVDMDAGLIATLSPDELRPADESSLWSILYSVEKLAESAPPVGESAQAARKRKLARRTHDEGCDRIERHLDARAKAAKARAKGDADKGKDKGEDGEEDEDGEEEEGDDPQ